MDCEKKIQDSLLETEKKYRLIVNNATVGIIITQDGFIKLVNPQAVTISGYSETELTTRPFVEFVHPKDRGLVLDYHVRRLKGEEIPETYLFRIISKDGQTKWIENKGVLITWEGCPATLNFLADVTERKLMEEALHQSETQKKAILDASIDRIRYVDADMKIIWANQTFSRELGIPPKAVTGRFCYELSRGRDAPCEGCPASKARETRQLERAVMYYPGKGGIGKERYWDSYSVPIIDDRNEITGFIQIARDITDQKKAEELVRNLSQLLIQAQERERWMISYELHDRIAQNLSTLKINCDTLFDGQSMQPPESIVAKLANISSLTEQTIIAVRDLAYDLRPPGLDEMGLVKALEIYCEEFSAKSGLHVDFQSAGIHGLNLDIDSELHIYRLAQEGLNNILKHAAADGAIVRLVGASPNIILRIEDNGKGFDIQARELALTSEKRMGLRSMRERVNLLQGQMTIESRLNKGTKIFIKFPVRERNVES